MMRLRPGPASILATALLVACGSSDAGPSRAPAPDAGAGGATNSGGSLTASGGNAASSGGASSGGTTAGPSEGGACLPDLARCDDETSCCAGAVCAGAGTDERRCRRACTDRTDCGSLCCLDDAAAGRKLCADASLCPAIECSGQGGPCTQVGEACCAGFVCVAWTNPPRSGCEKACTAPADCASGCCMPLAGTTGSFCAAAEVCQCAPLDAKCGGTQRCCAGLECTTFDASGAFACKPACKKDGDCASGCCAPLAGANASVCLSKEWCGGQ